MSGARIRAWIGGHIMSVIIPPHQIIHFLLLGTEQDMMLTSHTLGPTHSHTCVILQLTNTHIMHVTSGSRWALIEDQNTLNPNKGIGGGVLNRSIPAEMFATIIEKALFIFNKQYCSLHCFEFRHHTRQNILPILGLMHKPYHEQTTTRCHITLVQYTFIIYTFNGP